MRAEQDTYVDFDDSLIWIYDPNFPKATAAELAKEPLADFDRSMMVVDKQELARLTDGGHKIEFF
jgi:hypothetical protein